jgi:hypothetical protein
MSSMDAVTLMAKNNGFYVAQTQPAANIAQMVDVLSTLGSDPSLTLSLGLFVDAPDHEFHVMPAAALAKRLGVDPLDRDKWAGFHEIDGKWYVARSKRNMTYSSWLLLDRDTVPGMPTELEGLTREQWLAAMAWLLPGVDSAAHIILPSTGQRVLFNGAPMESKSWHLFTQVSDPADLVRVWPQMLVKSFPLTLEPDAPPWEADPVTLGFLRPKYSRTEPGLVVASQPWCIYDPSTCSPERLVFDGKPVAYGECFEVADPQIEVREGGRIDLSAFEDSLRKAPR